MRTWMHHLSTVALIVLTSVFAPLTTRSSAQEQPVATPMPAQACYFPPEAPLTGHTEAGQEVVVSFTSDCTPISTVYENPLPLDQTIDDLAHATGGASNQKAVGGPARVGALVRSASASAICHGSSRVHDYIHITLTHQHAYAKWYFDGTRVTGRSFTSSHTDADYLNDGWHIVDGPWFFWYWPNEPPRTPQGAEAWTGFEYVGGTYPIEHRVILWMDGYGGCWGDWYFTGYICNSCHLHYRVYIN